MTSDIDIYRSANELIKRHGDDAPIEAAIRADELAEDGDLEGRAVWLSWLEQRNHNPRVGGSSPSSATTIAM